MLLAGDQMMPLSSYPYTYIHTYIHTYIYILCIYDGTSYLPTYPSMLLWPAPAQDGHNIGVMDWDQQIDPASQLPWKMMPAGQVRSACEDTGIPTFMIVIILLQKGARRKEPSNNQPTNQPYIYYTCVCVYIYATTIPYLLPCLSSIFLEAITASSRREIILLLFMEDDLVSSRQQRTEQEEYLKQRYSLYMIIITINTYIHLNCFTRILSPRGYDSIIVKYGIIIVQQYMVWKNIQCMYVVSILVPKLFSMEGVGWIQQEQEALLRQSTPITPDPSQPTTNAAIYAEVNHRQPPVATTHPSPKTLHLNRTYSSVEEASKQLLMSESWTALSFS